MNALLWFTPLILFGFYWYDTAEAKELAVRHGRKACKDVNVQFLDESVIRYRTRIMRGYSGNLCLARDFRFEFTINGLIRHNGHIKMLGNRLQLLELDLPESDDQSNANHLILTASYSKDSDTNAICTRTQERPDCRD